MTYKHLIIDGVDVSEWEYYNKDDKTCREVNGNYDTDICEFDKCENFNCCYKQLKRKEQECEKYKQTLTEIEEIAMYIMDDDLEESSAYYDAKQILQKISECEAKDEN